MAFGISLSTWRGHNINDGSPYSAVFLTEDSETLNTMAAQAIEVQRPGNSPLRVRSQPTGLRFVIQVTIDGALSQDNLDQLKQWFDPTAEDEGELIGTDEAGTGAGRRIMAVCEKLSIDQGVTIFKAAMYAPLGMWEAASVTAPGATNVVASGQTFNLTNGGSAGTYPTFTLTPNTLKGHGDSWIRRLRLTVANRSRLPLTDPDATGRPILLATLDTSALNTAGKLLANLDDLRVLLDGEEIDRYLDPEGALSASTKVWANIPFQPGKIATLAAVIDSDDLSLSVSDAEGFAGWEQTGFAIIGSECVQYSAIEDGLMTIAARGARGTTAAAHNVGDDVIWVEHPNIEIVYDYTGAGAAPASSDGKPMFDLGDSNNGTWTGWTNYFAEGTRRAAQWQRRYTDDNPGSPFMRCYEAASAIIIENDFPEAGKPRANNAQLDLPCGLSALAVTRSSIGEADVEGYGWRKRVNKTAYTYTQVENGETTGEYFPDFHIVFINGADEVQLSARTYSFPTYSVEQDDVTQTELSSTFVAAKGADLSSSEYERIQTGTNVALGTRKRLAFLNGGAQYVELDRLQQDPTYSVMLKSQTDTTYEEEKGVVSADPVESKVYVIDEDGYESYLPEALTLSRTAYRVRLNANVPVGVDKDGNEFDAIPESARDSGAKQLYSAISMVFDASLTPLVLTSAEESVYLLDCRLKNDTTGEYVDLLLPMTLGESLKVDCEQHKVTDLETGLEAPFAMGGSWPTLEPGVNQWSYTEQGVVSVSVAGQWRDKYL